MQKALETADSETIIAKLVARCGKDSPIPLIMGLDSILAGIDTTGTVSNKFETKSDIGFLRKLSCILVLPSSNSS